MDNFFRDFFPSFALGVSAFILLKMSLGFARKKHPEAFQGHGFDWAVVFLSALAASLPTTYLKAFF